MVRLPHSLNMPSGLRTWVGTWRTTEQTQISRWILHPRIMSTMLIPNLSVLLQRLCVLARNAHPWSQNQESDHRQVGYAHKIQAEYLPLSTSHRGGSRVCELSWWSPGAMPSISG